MNHRGCPHLSLVHVHGDGACALAASVIRCMRICTLLLGVRSVPRKYESQISSGEYNHLKFRAQVANSKPRVAQHG